jgi:hypothetical protein
MRHPHDHPWEAHSPATALVVTIALGILATACGQSTSTSTVTTRSTVNGRPQGGSVPTNLLGDWYLPPDIVVAVEGNSSCRMLKLTLTATTYRLTHDPACGVFASTGEVVVNKTEMDFFNADACGLKLPDGVGRYTWTLSAGLLHFAALSHDPCPRGDAWLNNRTYSRTDTA